VPRGRAPGVQECPLGWFFRERAHDEDSDAGRVDGVGAGIHHGRR
jgi:hypothetical protein